MVAKYVVVGVVLGVLLSSAVVAVAGGLEPQSAPADTASQMWTLEQIYDRLDTGAVSAKMTSFTEPASGPGAGTMHTLDEVMDLAMAVGDPDPPCFDNGNRYVDCDNGTVYDTVTNLIWLKNANCYGWMDWTEASYAVLGLEDGECDLTDGSSPGDWRLPTREEWETTLARAIALNCTESNNGMNPLLTNKPGTACYSFGWPAFNNVVKTGFYWGSTASDLVPNSAWIVSMQENNSGYVSKVLTNYVWPVRDGQ